MTTAQKILQIHQLDTKLAALNSIQKVSLPPTGWIKAIRMALGMSLLQLGNKLGITKQSAMNMELREAEGAITLHALREAAQALDMELVYGFVPKDGSLNALVERKAKALATQVVMRTSNTMKLEDQENSQERIRDAINERTIAIKNELPKTLWD